MRKADGCRLEALRLLGFLVTCDDELPEPVPAKLVTIAGTDGEASSIVEEQAGHVAREMDGEYFTWLREVQKFPKVKKDRRERSKEEELGL